jgi:hypothetical protein
MKQARASLPLLGAVCALAGLLAPASPVDAQPIINDPQADIHVARPDYPQGGGPLVAIDSGHNNFHSIRRNFGPFADLLRNDGLRVVDSSSPFTRENLSSFKILVVADALPATTAKGPRTSSAFSKAETDALKSWVAGGGSLLLIADQRPFAGSARALALAFGFRFEDGIVARDPMDSRADIFTRADKSLRDDVVTRGRDSASTITSLRTFGGSGFRAPPAARPLIVFPHGFMNHACSLPCPPGAAESDASGSLQGAVMTFGKGRIAVFGEAAMFSAQVWTTLEPPFHFGFQAKGAEQNKQFILNLMQWLAGLLPP